MKYEKHLIVCYVCIFISLVIFAQPMHESLMPYKLNILILYYYYTTAASNLASTTIALPHFYAITTFPSSES